ncbi:hypothetical protein SAMN06264364_101220 [Quadrisphaera granulorum]|uniref:Uncharacterized protein n=1 Tax=Quadrisphaera granulorum TaxID=317664 RepID=A0A316AEN5_9ACTN|nr:hypothetical protein [Quadrisphaera granulorum]PWJ56245.1 hypothetical protein BXY45_101220 [Quadrisphaera granulorum]SZE94879.1 hypothetical protein SAMN06264364_101220 [Quadrisphaera granulorum]
MTWFMDNQFEVSSFDLRVPTAGGFHGTAVPAPVGSFADGPAAFLIGGAPSGQLSGQRRGGAAGYGHALRQRPDAVALISNPPVSGLPPVRRQVLTS